MIQDLPLGYVARKPFDKFHARKQRWSVIVAHRRAGKTVACILDLIDGALRCPHERPRFAYVAPYYTQAKDVAWDYVKKYGLQVPGATINESELRIDFPAKYGGGRVRLYGGENPDRLRGLYLDGVIIDEAQDMSPRVFTEIIRPQLIDRQGWATWIGTPKGENDFYELWTKVQEDETYFKMMVRASQSGILSQLELEDSRRHMGPERYQQEMECSFQSAVFGSYYGKEMEAAEAEQRIVSGIYDPTLSVSTAWDLGHSDQTCIWFFQSGGFEIRVIDVYAAHSHGLEHYVSVLQERSARPGNEKGYKYAQHYLPHDVGVVELGTGRSRIEQLRSLGLFNVKVVPKMPIDDGINAVRKILPRCWFDKTKCEIGLKALRQYSRKYDDIRKCFYETPLHDWTSDYADAFRYLAIGFEEPVQKKAANKIRRDDRWIY